ncbi:MAG: hypothetical protein IH595_04065 [Bacteroidales bacterium]|nr:hypothetical protein [Bacteroidales bacterium]
MKKLKFICILFIGFLPLALFGQGISENMAKDDFWRIQQRDNGTTSIKIPYSKIQGSPYLNTQFGTGQIFTKEQTLYGSYPLRYNVFTGNFEFRKSNSEVFELNAPGMVGKIDLDDTTFVYAPYLDKQVTSNGFFQLLNSGTKAQGLIRYSIEFLKATPPGAYQDAQPARFSSVQKDYYVRFGQEPAVLIYKNSDFLKALPDKKSEITKFIKKEKIHASREDDLIKLLNYYNSL